MGAGLTQGCVVLLQEIEPCEGSPQSTSHIAMSAVPRINEGDDTFLHWRSIDGAKFLLADTPKPDHCGVHSHDKVRVSFLLKGRIVEVDGPAKAVECNSMALHTTPPGMRH